MSESKRNEPAFGLEGGERHVPGMRRSSPGLLGIGAVVTLCVAATVAPREAGPATLSVPGRSNANVSLAASGTFVAAAWSASVPGGATDIYAAASRDGGTTFSAPARVNATAGAARVNGEQPPRLALIARSGRPPSIVVVWTSKRPAGTVLLAARSDDGGRTFGANRLVPGTDAAGNRGWESVVPAGGGDVRMLWLDHREMAPPQESTSVPHAGHDASSTAKRDGVAMAQLSKLYTATLDDPASARAITAGVCYCCKTALARGEDGAIYAAWRHVYPGNLRDIAFTVSRDAGRTFAPARRVSEDGWQLDGCPDDGPAMSVDARSRVHIAWPTLVTDQPGGQPAIAIFYAMSADGRTFTRRQRVPSEGAAHHPQLGVGRDGAIVVAWDELKDARRRVIAALATASGDGVVQFRRQVVDDSEPAAFPVVQHAAGGPLVAWTSGPSERSAIKILRLR